MELDDYNKFCEGLREGYILYNIDSTNSWGEYFLVASILTIRIMEVKTYSLLLLGLARENGNLIPRNVSIKITPDLASSVPFLKPVGYCDFRLLPSVSNVSLNVGLATVYGNVDLHKFATKLSVRKPKKKKYGKDGKLIIKK